jgi:hypothetical protein
MVRMPEDFTMSMWAMYVDPS